jgi:signal transduction histidine kinase
VKRLPITVRIAALAALLSIATALALAALIWQQTHEDAIGVLRRDAAQQADTLASVYRTGGIHALDAAIAEISADDPDNSLVAALVDAQGRRRIGVGPDRLARPLRPGFAIGVIGSGNLWSQSEAGVELRALGRDYLVTGRLLNDWERTQRAIERTLLWAIVAAALLGIVGGVILSRYVARRVDRIATVVEGAAAGDMSRRVGLRSTGGDAFDRLGARVDGMLERIERLVGELRVVTDSVGHDLRSPLMRLRSRAEQAATAGDPAQRDAAIAGVLSEADIMLRMLSTLLEISRAEAGGGAAAFQRVDLATLLNELGDLYAPVAEDAGATLEVALPAEPPGALPVHRELLSQALANLIDNALKYAPEAAIVLRLARLPAGETALSVADRGPGIAEAERAEALARFGRLDAARGRPGAGLGLSLVDSVARLHGGRLELGDNAPGLVAIIVLPAD